MAAGRHFLTAMRDSHRKPPLRARGEKDLANVISDLERLTVASKAPAEAGNASAVVQKQMESEIRALKLELAKRDYRITHLMKHLEEAEEGFRVMRQNAQSFASLTSLNE